MSLGVSQVEGIVHLVASAVEGLEPGNITVLDTSGKILSKRNDTTLVGQLTTTQLEYQRNIEEGLKKKAQGMLEEVLGPNKAIARVSTDIDFQQVDITEERYDPSTVLRSEQKNTERSSASSGAAIPSSDAKKEPAADTKTPRPRPGAPSEPSVKPPAGSSAPITANSSERQHEIRNYEISRINKHIKNPVGKVIKVSAAVIVDGAYKEAADAKGKKEKQYVPRSPDEMKNLENIVKKAIGYDEERGDQVEVINMPFYWSVSEEETKTVKSSPWQDYLLIAYKPIVSLILALLFIMFIIRPLLKRGFFSPGRVTPGLQSISSPMTSPESLPGPRPAASLNLRDQTVQLVREDPSKAAGVVKTWIHEKE
jgi:flagellar M-ring protein FliF